METYEVILTKEYIATGTIIVEAESAEEAEAIVQKMMDDPQNPLQTNDKRIEWDDPEYVDYSFKIDDVQQ